MAKILVVEDDEQLLNIIGRWLTNEHHTAELLVEGEEALFRLKTYDYDLVILDWGLPDMQGIDVIKEYRGHKGKAPMLMLTARNSIEERVQGLDTGADDYLTKPFHAKELLARVNSLLRRPNPVSEVATLKLGDIELDLRRLIAHADGEEHALPPREFALLEFFMRHPGKIHSSEHLLHCVWPDDDSGATPEALATCVRRLRKKFKQGELLIRNVHGEGYGFFVE